ncbi:MAG: rhodanese-related sulfurtransferase [Beijerinckiaceae bacterium]
MPVSVAAFYRFHPVADPAALQEPLRAHLVAHGVRGIVLLAPEGINATIACAGDIGEVMQGVERITGLGPLERKLSSAERMPFRRLKVRLKKEIVTIGDANVDPLAAVGTYVEPRDWNALISDPDVLVIDTRNSFEHDFGTFEGAVDPKTGSFGGFPAYVREHLASDTSRRIAMFCTGGIRCEKATSLLKREGFENVFHLKGGILKYLEEVPEAQSLWRGGCFVFDERVALTHGLRPAGLAMCLACNAPVDEAGRAAPEYEEGVSCSRCAALTTPAQKASARERQRQLSSGSAPPTGARRSGNSP